MSLEDTLTFPESRDIQENIVLEIFHNYLVMDLPFEKF